MQLGYGRREAVEHLLAMGANVLARDDGGLIPLHNACSFGHAEVSLFYFLKLESKISSFLSIKHYMALYLYTKISQS